MAILESENTTVHISEEDMLDAVTHAMLESGLDTVNYEVLNSIMNILSGKEFESDEDFLNEVGFLVYEHTDEDGNFTLPEGVHTEPEPIPDGW